VNLRAGYAGERWVGLCLGRNVFDQRFAVRGFYFGLEPPDFADRLVRAAGRSAQFGVTISWSLR